MLPGVTFVEFNDVADLKRKFDSSVCAICIETIQGEGGIRPVSFEFLNAARSLTKRSGALLLLDEIQCGLGRTGKYFAYQHYDVQPDIVTVAKPLAGGLPLGAILTSNRVANAIHPGMHGSTFGGGPLTCAVAIEFLQILDQSLDHITEIGKYFRRNLDRLKDKHACAVDVRGMGLMLAMELDSSDVAKAVVSEMLKRKILINRTNDTVLRFLPPYIVEKKHVDQVISALDSALQENMPHKNHVRRRSQTKRKGNRTR